MTQNNSIQMSVTPAPPVVSFEGKSWIQKTPGVCGGRACIRNTRLTVWGLVSYRRLGLSDARQQEIIEGLTQADLDAAWQYYQDHQAEIDEDIRQNQEA